MLGAQPIPSRGTRSALPDPYEIGELAQARGFRDTFSAHGGMEHGFEPGRYPIVVRAGASYERSAVPPEYLSVLMVDLDKIQLAAGSSWYVGDKRNIRLDAVLGVHFRSDDRRRPARGENHQAEGGSRQLPRSRGPDEDQRRSLHGRRHLAGLTNRPRACPAGANPDAERGPRAPRARAERGSRRPFHLRRSRGRGVYTSRPPSPTSAHRRRRTRFAA